LKTRVRGLSELARLFGLETSYEAMDGSTRRADAEAVMLTLRALGAQLNDEDDAADALAARRAELAALGLQPVHVAWGGALPGIPMRLAANESARAAIEIRLESGDVITHPCRADPVRARPRSGWQPTHSLHFGRRLPVGYHRLQVETSGSTYESLIIAAPKHAWVPPAPREWGAFVPLYALCSEHSLGTANYTDLQRLAQWLGEQGAGFVSTLPLLATFLDAPFEPSPYSPASRLFWSELFVDVTRAPGWTPDHTTDTEVRACRAGDLVDYRRAAALLRRELTRALRAVSDDANVQNQLRHFATSTPYAEEYARFRAVGDRRREGWHAWPERLRDGDIRDADYSFEDLQYHLFAQWQADTQLATLSTASDDGGASLYLDMPLGVNSASFDAWRFRDLFADGVAAGAPPDPLFTGGQNWGFRPLNPRALRRTGYAYLIDSLRHHLRHAHMLRLDHVMSLYRLFWVPDGLGAKRGVYVRYPEDEMFAVLVMESARHRAVVVGEDLGTVPDAVRRAMDRRGVQRMHVVQFEASPANDPPVAPPAGAVVASLNTHDMPMFAGFWRGTEIDDQLALGLIDADEHKRSMQQRAVLRRKLSRNLGGGGEIDVGVARQRLLERLAASAAHYVLVSLEDLWLEDRPQNVPGTSDERPNWQRRARRSLEDIMNDAAIRRMLRAIAERRAASQPGEAADE
jgi:4-alpha-glucanotransferase